MENLKEFIKEYSDKAIDMSLGGGCTDAPKTLKIKDPDQQDKVSEFVNELHLYASSIKDEFGFTEVPAIVYFELWQLAKRLYRTVIIDQLIKQLDLLGVDDITTSTGRKIAKKSSIKAKISSTPTEASRALKQAIEDANLSSEGYLDKFKTGLTIENPSTQIQQELIDKGVVYDIDTKIHHSSLNALINELVSLGVEIPKEHIDTITIDTINIK